jgi:hypothetical protein
MEGWISTDRKIGKIKLQKCYLRGLQKHVSTGYGEE